MDPSEATKIVMSRICNIDPQHASKIMGYILLHDQHDNNIIRLALGPDTFLHSVINQAKSVLHISSNTSSAPSSSSRFPHQTPPRLLLPNNHVNVFKPCFHFARGFCKKGRSCNFVHANDRYNNNFLDQTHRFGRFRPDRHDLAATGLGNSSSSSHRIYITFQAKSTFTNEDVSKYFSNFGPVQDVEIPDQPMRMFGFVTFVLAETVRLVLAKRNFHFVCGSRVIVKPYKDKRTITIEKQQQQIERGDISAFESAGAFDRMPFGARMFNHDMMLRRNQEGHDQYQQTVDFQERRLRNMQFNAEWQCQHSLSHSQMNPNLVHVNRVNARGDNRSVEHLLPDSLFSSPGDDAGGSANINQTSL